VSPSLRSVSSAVLPALLFCGAPIAQGQQADDTTTMVEIRIGAVMASQTGDMFDHRLAALRRSFDSLFQYSSYRLLREERRRVKLRREAEFHLPGGRYVVIIPRDCKDGRIALHMMLLDGSRPLINTSLSIRDHGTFLVGGPSYKDGVLIIAIGAGTLPGGAR
jgi:hypothetical protein